MVTLSEGGFSKVLRHSIVSIKYLIAFNQFLKRDKYNIIFNK